jgi:hypothetical protein
LSKNDLLSDSIAYDLKGVEMENETLKLHI